VASHIIRRRLLLLRIYPWKPNSWGSDRFVVISGKWQAGGRFKLQQKQRKNSRMKQFSDKNHITYFMKATVHDNYHQCIINSSRLTIKVLQSLVMACLLLSGKSVVNSYRHLYFVSLNRSNSNGKCQMSK